MSLFSSHDKIRIVDLTVQAIVGVNPIERTKKQNLVINLTLHCDLQRCGETDSISDTLNYSTVSKKVLAFVEEEKAYTLERLASGIAHLCLFHVDFAEKVHSVKVRVDKPGALTLAKYVLYRSS